MANAVLPSVSLTTGCCFEMPGDPHWLKSEVWAKRAESIEGAFHWMVFLRWEFILESISSCSSVSAAGCSSLSPCQF